MSRKIRRTLFFFFVLLFLTLTPLISLYATGYRINFTWPLKFDQLLVKTGTLILETKPTGAVVTLTNNNQWHFLEKYFKSGQITTPLKIKNLLPGEYNLTLTLSGYWTFNKTVDINPGESTYLNKIVLFRQDLPAKVLDAALQPLELTADKNHLALMTSQEIVDLKTETTTTDLAWPPTADTASHPDITLIKPSDAKLIAWVDDNQFLYANDFEIYRFYIDSGYKQLITRLSQPLTGLIYEVGDYIIYSTEKISPPILNAKGDTLYFTAQIGTQEGLYKLAIK